MAKALYMNDCYLKEFEATVVNVSGDGEKEGKFITLDKTAFYPNSGGQPWDEGTISKDGTEFRVVFVGKFSGEISHEVDNPGLRPGDRVKCSIDWERRHKLMRMHTAAHIISGILFHDAGALITGNQLGLDKTRIDFSMDDFDRDKLQEYINKANDCVNRDCEIRISEMPREDVEKNPDLVRLAKGLPPGIKVLRMVEIFGLDIQPDGGTHVKSTKEVGRIEFIGAENKGKNNRRMYFTLKD
ncbi:MAG: alanyl-tRNA editing protein [Candidatus Aenigmarchaeota archaeon]|nr:alanyl-tRNA editing protein [Candidatus Aenigmarchaeota archaeon]